MKSGRGGGTALGRRLRREESLRRFQGPQNCQLPSNKSRLRMKRQALLQVLLVTSHVSEGFHGVPSESPDICQGVVGLDHGIKMVAGGLERSGRARKPLLESAGKAHPAWL